LTEGGRLRYARNVPIFLTLEDKIRHHFRNRKKGGDVVNWYPVTCRTAVKFLRANGVDAVAPRPGYETVVRKERGQHIILTNNGGKCEFSFYQHWTRGMPLEGARRRKRR
jgi:hypothetical protein